MKRLFQFIANQLAVLTFLCAVLAYLYPPLFLIFKDYFLWFFAATMFALGLVLDSGDLKNELSHPRRIGLGVLTQFSVMPLLAFGMAQYPGFSPAIALGFIIVGCAPGAMASNVIVYLAGGAVAFSVTLTTVATFLSPLLTPMLVKFLGGAIMPIEFLPLMKTILLTVLVPLALGLLIQPYLGRRLALARSFAPGVAAIAIIVICSYAVAANQLRIQDMALPVLLAVILINVLGYIIGWWLSRLYGFDHYHRITLMIELGMQNAGMGVALALKHFPPEAALPGALFAVWCILTAATASSWLRKHHHKITKDALI
ncbi:MAG: bile acid:sodium symporter family protein [Gammaproteobacteria bacterium]|nr:bile acid:sodium symporter family protein [Gammaproteobacteria bacterium]MCW8910138.1 bile acid:sodium symporter family protein [Gammaproteobacteria bacterium]MCW9005850.1 bile acid:sodium symporter family protein [Gammaproteobacteria bacterium]MCW9055344.1 bile acid:sodium symporter family protein [Gammaproteobacteria bacterium]